MVHLLAILGLDLISKGRYAGLGPWRLWCFAGIQILALAAFIAFNVYLWITAPHFGSQPMCNHSTVYVVFGVSINAVSPVFRYLILATLGSSAAAFGLVFTCILPCWCTAWICRRRNPGESTSSSRKRDCNKYLTSGSSNVEHQSQTAVDESTGQALLRNTWQKGAYCGFCIYLIVSLEQTIARNNLDPEEKGWTFGQVIAIFLLLGVANEFLNVVLATWDRELGKAHSQELEQLRRRSSDRASMNLV